METAELIAILKGITALSEKFIDALQENWTIEYYQQHQILNAAGHLERGLYFMEKGLARNYYYDQEGNAHTVRFWEPGMILFSFEGYYSVPSYFYTEVIAESRFTVLSYKNLHELDKIFPEVGELIKKILLRYQHEEYEKQKLLALAPELRYQTLRKIRPDLFKKIPARIIASYLHMTRETLTRYIGRN